MAFSGARSALSSYSKVRAESGVAAASPHGLITMLLEGAMERIAVAKGHMLRDETADKGACISRVIGILDGLRISLDKSAGGDLATNLDDLYDYMDRCLLRGELRKQHRPAG